MCIRDRWNSGHGSCILVYDGKLFSAFKRGEQIIWNILKSNKKFLAPLRYYISPKFDLKQPLPEWIKSTSSAHPLR